MQFLVSMLPSLEALYKISLVYYIRNIGLQWIDVLIEHRSMFEQMKKNPALKDSANSCLDLMDGRRYKK